jgi:hypothetical protein
LLVVLTVTATIAAATTTTALLAILLAVGALAGVGGAIGVRCTSRLAFRTRATLPTFRAGATATTTVVGAWATFLPRTALAFVTGRLG